MEVNCRGLPLIIIRGNSPNACSFVPRDVNQLLNGRDALRGEWPVGDTCNGGLILVTRHLKKRLLCTRLPKKLRLRWWLCDNLLMGWEVTLFE